MAHKTGRVAIKRCADPRYYNGSLHDGFVTILHRENLAGPASHFSLAEFCGLAQFMDDDLHSAILAELRIAANHGTDKLVIIGHEDCSLIKDLLGTDYSMETERKLLEEAARIGAKESTELGYHTFRATTKPSMEPSSFSMQKVTFLLLSLPSISYSPSPRRAGRIFKGIFDL